MKNTNKNKKWKWKNGNKNMGKDGFNTGNISLWISFVILVINCYQDYFQHINSVI